jgi:hypothetical protein
MVYCQHSYRYSWGNKIGHGLVLPNLLVMYILQFSSIFRCYIRKITIKRTLITNSSGLAVSLIAERNTLSVLMSSWQEKSDSLSLRTCNGGERSLMTLLLQPNCHFSCYVAWHLLLIQYHKITNIFLFGTCRIFSNTALGPHPVSIPVGTVGWVLEL